MVRLARGTVCAAAHGRGALRRVCASEQTGPATTDTLALQIANKVRPMSLGLIVLIIVVLMLVGVVPAWPHARGWGYGPSGIVGVILLIVVVLFVMGRL